MATRRVLVTGWVLAVCLCRGLLAGGVPAATDTLPSRLADDDFWQIVQQFSERAGTFPSDNLLSNERTLQYVIPELARTV